MGGSKIQFSAVSYFRTLTFGFRTLTFSFRMLTVNFSFTVIFNYLPLLKCKSLCTCTSGNCCPSLALSTALLYIMQNPKFTIYEQTLFSILSAHCLYKTYCSIWDRSIIRRILCCDGTRVRKFL